MQQKTNGIILQNTKFQDKKNILKIYTLQQGIQSYVVNIGHSGTSKIKPAHVIALNQIEFIEQVKKTRSIQLISDIHVSYIYQNLFTNPLKNTVAIFLNEVLLKALREQPDNSELYRFIVKSFIVFDDRHYEATNFHLHFLIELSKYLGFYPNNNYTPQNCLFDIQEGIFISHIPGHLYYADSELSFYLSELLRLKSDFTCHAKTRAELLNLIITLYRLHIPNFGEIKSVQVLKEILA